MLGLAISAVVAALAAGVAWALAGGAHHPDHTAAAGRPGMAKACTGVALTPASDVQAAIDRAPPGTTFCFGRGIYRVSSLAPKSGDVLDGGNRAAVLDGDKTAFFAIDGDASRHAPADVTVRGFVIRDFNTPLQLGAIDDFNGPGWVIQDNQITQNAAAGIATGDTVRVIGNTLDHNGQEGFAAHGAGGLYADNDIGYNNDNLAIDAGWEAGGGKAYATKDLTFKDNYVHDNGGPGLWADTDNVNTTFDGNTISDNWGAGIYEEISYSATIIGNRITGNGMPSSPGGGNRQGWAWDAGIQLRLSGGLSASSPLVISGNTVADNYNGISLIASPPSGCAGLSLPWYGPCQVQFVRVEDNWITMTQGATGAYQDGSGNGIFTRQDNVFRDNHFCVASSVHPDDGYAYGWFGWLNGWQDFTTWQITWLQSAGTFTVGTGSCHLTG